MTLTSNAKVEYARPTRGLPSKKKIMGLSLTVMEIWAFEVCPCFSIQGCVGLPYTRHRREHVLEHVRISIGGRIATKNDCFSDFSAFSSDVTLA